MIAFLMAINNQANEQEKERVRKFKAKEKYSLTEDIVHHFVKYNGQKCSKTYKKISFLGKGGFAECYLTQQTDTLKKQATKVISKKLIQTYNAKKQLMNEIKIHQTLKNPNIVEFYNNFEDQENFYICLEPCESQSLHELIAARRTLQVPEIQSILYGLCLGTKFLHSRNIIHRDLKSGNIFLTADMKVKIGDFGLACLLEFDNELKRTICGTPNYLAPEVLFGKGYSFEIDLWAIGIIVYCMFFTYPPFESEDPFNIYTKIRKGDYEIPDFRQIPKEGVDLIQALLSPNPANRPTIQQILDSPFMRLGGSVLDGIPPICKKRPPTNIQLANWPKVENIITNMKAREDSFSFNQTGFALLNFNSNLTQNFRGIDALNVSMLKFNKEEESPVFCWTIEKIQQVIVFVLSNRTFGVFDVKKAEIFHCSFNSKSEKVEDPIKKLSKNKFGQIIKKTISLSECPHKILLSLKHKQLLQAKSTIFSLSSVSSSVYISKVKIFQDLFLIRFSNRVTQLIFNENDGFLLSSDHNQLHYFDRFYGASILDGREVDVNIILCEDNNKKNKENIENKDRKGNKENKENMENTENMGQKQKVKKNQRLSIDSIFKTKSQEKSLLTMKKISYLKQFLRIHRNVEAQETVV